MSNFEQLTDHTKIASVFLYLKTNGLHFNLSDLDVHKTAVKDILNLTLPNLLDHFRVERPKSFDKIEALNKSLADFIPDLEYLFSIITVSNFLVLVSNEHSEVQSSKIIDINLLAINAINTTLDLFEFALTSSDTVRLSRDLFKRNVYQYAEPFFKHQLHTQFNSPENSSQIRKLGTWLLVKALPLKPN